MNKVYEVAQDAFKIYGESLHKLNGLDSVLLAVVSSNSITLYQGYEDSEYLQSIYLPDDCFKQLIKLMREYLEEG